MTAIYFIRHGDLIKVGHSNAVERRVQAIMRGRRGADVMGIIPCTPKTALGFEAAWHRRFKAWRQHGEWFQASPEVIAAITAEADVAALDIAKTLRPKPMPLSDLARPMACLFCGSMMPSPTQDNRIAHCPSCGATMRIPMCKARRAAIGSRAALMRAANQSPANRSAIARNAAQSRWAKEKP